MSAIADKMKGNWNLIKGNLKKKYGKARCLKRGCLKIEYCALINAKQLY